MGKSISGTSGQLYFPQERLLGNDAQSPDAAAVLFAVWEEGGRRGRGALCGTEESLLRPSYQVGNFSARSIAWKRDS
jgi:hypothetical protein